MFLPAPCVKKLFHAPSKSETPPLIGTALTSPQQSKWLDCLFNAYDNMHRTGTSSLPFKIIGLPEDTTILRPRVTCEVKIKDSDNYYKLKCRICADGSHMIMGIDYDLSYDPVIDGDIFLLMLAVVTSLNMDFFSRNLQRIPE